MVTAPSALALLLFLLFGAVFEVHSSNEQQQQQQLQSELQDSSMGPDERWYAMPKPMYPTATNNKEIADQRYHPVPTPESQLSPTMLRLLLLNQSARGGRVESYSNKRSARTAALAATIHRKIRAEGENMANMLGMLKKMEECMKMTEGLRFRKRSIGEEELNGNNSNSSSTPEDVYRALTAGKRADSGHRIRALKNLCQI